MKTLVALLTLMLIVAIILMPVVMIFYGLSPLLPVWLRIVLICAGLVISWFVKPLSILLNRDFKII